MFTGIIQAVGEITHIAPLDDGVSLRIATGQLDLSDVKIGDSIALNGVCLTVTAVADGLFSVDVSRETLNCTVDMDKQGNKVNLEKALRLSDRLGGHLVSGHVDGVGEVIRFMPAGESYLLALRMPLPLLKYIAKKGSIAVNGVSLTVNTLTGDQVEINLIPHTLSATTLNKLEAGAKVNIEVDMLARYVERLIGNQMNLD
jgi:riboflavin synthase